MTNAAGLIRSRRARWSRADPEISLFGRNPRARLAAIRSRNVEGSWVEVSTTAGPTPPGTSRSQVSNPSSPGSTTSSRTTSGQRSAASRIAVSPSGASPTTSYPSSSSTVRTRRRKPAWSSTISRVGRGPGIALARSASSREWVQAGHGWVPS